MPSEYTPEQLKALMEFFTILPIDPRRPYICGCCGTSYKEERGDHGNTKGLFNVWVAPPDRVKEPEDGWDSIIIPDAKENVTIMWKEGK